MNRFVVSANYLVKGKIQKRTYFVAAKSMSEALRSAKTEDLLQVTSVVLDDTPLHVDPFSLPEETGNKNV